MMEVYLSPTANCRRVSVMLECCHLDHVVKAVDRDRKEHKTPEFLKLNPEGAVPVLVDTGDASGKPLVLAQSGAILLHLAELSGRFLPDGGERRWKVLQAFMQVMTDVNPTASIHFVLGKSAEANASAETKDFVRARFVNFLASCDQLLAGNQFLAGDMSIADIALYPVCRAHQGVIDGADGLSRLRAWMDRMDADPAVRKGMEAI